MKYLVLLSALALMPFRVFVSSVIQTWKYNRRMREVSAWFRYLDVTGKE